MSVGIISRGCSLKVTYESLLLHIRVLAKCVGLYVCGEHFITTGVLIPCNISTKYKCKMCIGIQSVIKSASQIYLVYFP